MQYQVELIRGANVSKEEPNQGYVYKIFPTGNFVMEVSEEFNLFLTTLINGGMRLCVFDLTHLKYVDSTGIGIFINITKYLRTKGGDLVFQNIQPKILEVFNLVKLGDFIQFCKSEKQVTEHLFSLARK